VKGGGMKIGTGLKRKMADMDDDDEGLVKKEVKMEQMDGEEISSDGTGGTGEGNGYTAGSEEGFMSFASASASEGSKDKDILGSPGNLMNGIGEGDSMKRAQELLVGGATLTEEQRVWALREGGYLRSGNETAAAAEEEAQVQLKAVQTKAVQPKAREPLIRELESEPEPEPEPVQMGMRNNETGMVLVMENAFVVDSSSGSSS
jgi:hypothetical protein